MITSGAIYKEVPAQVLSFARTFFDLPPSPSILSRYEVDNPKSINFIRAFSFLFSNKKFSGFKSL
jgi:hypothetical protein